MRKIQLKDAKATLSAVVNDAVRGQAAVITRHGRRGSGGVGLQGMGTFSKKDVR